MYYLFTAVDGTVDSLQYSIQAFPVSHTVVIENYGSFIRPARLGPVTRYNPISLKGTGVQAYQNHWSTGQAYQNHWSTGVSEPPEYRRIRTTRVQAYQNHWSTGVSEPPEYRRIRTTVINERVINRGDSIIYGC